MLTFLRLVTIYTVCACVKHTFNNLGSKDMIHKTFSQIVQKKIVCVHLCMCEEEEKEREEEEKQATEYTAV